MERIVIQGRSVITPQGEVPNAAVVVENGKIQEILQDVPVAGDFTKYEYVDGIISPGFIDVHIHGANGHDTMDGTYEALNAISSYLASTGTTGFLATTVTSKHADLLHAIQAVKKAKERGTEGAAILGMHLEGPYINIAKKGAQNGEFVRKPDPNELQSYIALLGEDFKLITLAPELDEGFQTIALAKNAGAVVSAGHSCCSYETALAAFDAGVTHATHLFNGMEPLHHREPGLVGAVLADPRVSAELIVDNIHVHAGAIRVVMAAKGLEKIILITDCMRAGNLPDGFYDLGGLNVSVKNGIARTESGSLAGSTLRMIDAVKNMVQLCGVPLADAVHLASRNPAQIIGLGDKKGTLEVGKDADIIVFDKDFHMHLAVVEGKVRYER